MITYDNHYYDKYNTQILYILSKQLLKLNTRYINLQYILKYHTLVENFR